MATFHLRTDTTHATWNRDQRPAIHVSPGDVVTLDILDSSDGQVHPDSTVDTVANLDFGRVNPVTGPVFVDGAQPGDALVITVMAVDVADWGWTANIPGFGLLSDAFPEPHLRISQITAGYAQMLPGIRVPICPFIGTIGLAPEIPGDHPLVPPTVQGGNMDVRHVTAHSRLWLPVAVPGALLSVGDTHAAQGDGEVAGTAIETSGQVTLKIDVKKKLALKSPELETDPRSHRQGPAWVTTGIGPDLFRAARQAVEHMIERLARELRLAPDDAYLLLSAAGDLKISEIVDAPNWVVSMHLPTHLWD
ncbi:acetamidase/formamidase family protein [Sulfobacillus harzensis]|uniref:Acetamidase/formamidase family protein n=1 Tax=Sulfobacillus harzensis TaxID=2729629 RepID=A0A7Y0Q3A9_9FIRM|nr:acetamidase/formamidase family protein [Sulfobacillus harzensis]NMP22786.1 acetamidase/formamidase family protein [Sulfobacillus harzensis]